VTAIAGALRRALPIMFTARIAALATLPLLVAAVVWIAIGVLAWDPANTLLLRALGTEPEAAAWQRVAAGAVVVLALAALAAATALAAIAVLTMPVIVKTVASRHFPQLAARRGGTLGGSLRNVLAALLAFAALWIATLPLLVIPPAYVAASLVLNAWLSQRMFRYDALAEHASASELGAVLRENRMRLMGLGLVLAPLSLIPVVNILVLPIYAGIAYTELCLAELAALRARNASVPA